MPAKNPVDMVVEMQEQGRDDSDVIAELTNKGLSPEQISNAINQARIKSAISSKSSSEDRYPIGEKSPMSASISTQEDMGPSIMSPSPSPSNEVVPYSQESPPQEQFYDYAQSGVDTEAIEEIAEEIIREKWDEAKAKISGILEWKDYSNTRLANMEGKMRRIESLIDELQTALLGKVQLYEQNIKDLGTEMKSIQGAFSKVLSPLSSNVKELQKLTGKLYKAEHTGKGIRQK